MKKHARTIVVTAALCSVLAIAGCKSDQDMNQDSANAVSMGAVNSVCPIMPSHSVNPNTSEYAMYNGHKIGFCCGGCINTWENKTAAEKDAFLAQYVK